MANSLRAKISKLRHDGNITDAEYQLIKKLDEHDAKVRADAIDECIKKLSEAEDTILSDKQYYTLGKLKE